MIFQLRASNQKFDASVYQGLGRDKSLIFGDALKFTDKFSKFALKLFENYWEILEKYNFSLEILIFHARYGLRLEFI